MRGRCGAAAGRRGGFAAPVVLAAWLLLAAGCAAGGPRPAPPGSGWAADPAGGAETGRRLYRVSYQGPAGGGSLRLALAVAGEDRYQARATDAFGRGLWSLELAGSEVLIIDHRRREHCVSGPEVALPELALAALPVDRLPAVLAGRLPASPARPGADPDDFLDAAGQRWTASRDAAGLEAWSLWQGGRPVLWFGRLREGGVLSHRDGSQFRWRRSVEEPLSGELEPLPVPEGYRETSCGGLVSTDPSIPGDLTASPRRF